MTQYQPITLPALYDYPITQRWAPEHPERLQLYSVTTPNGVKISIALEEMGIDYEPHFVSFSDQEQLSPEFLSLNPNNKIPAIIDPNASKSALTWVVITSMSAHFLKYQWVAVRY